MTQWALLIGDCIHNTRSALDHFFWALVLLKHPKGNPPDDHKAAFPIFRKIDTFRARKGQIEQFVGPQAATILEGLQPFQTTTPDDDIFAFLHKSDITDKHRLLIPNVGLIERGRCITKTRDGSPPPTVKTNVFLQDSLHDGAVLSTVIVSPPNAVVDVNIEVTRLGIFFERGGGRTYPVLKALADLIETAEAVPEQFPDFFPIHGRIP